MTVIGRSIKVCSAKLAIVSSVADSQSTLSAATAWHTNATLSCSQTAAAARLDDDVLTALPKRNTMARTLERARQKAATGCSGFPVNGFCAPSAAQELQHRVFVCVAEVSLWMRSNRLQLNPAKTGSFGSPRVVGSSRSHRFLFAWGPLLLLHPPSFATLVSISTRISA